MRDLKNKFIPVWNSDHHRLYLVGAVLAVCAIVGILFVTIGYEETWQLWTVPTGKPFFLDVRLIPGMVETLHMGLDPTIENPGDPSGRIFNYPPIWYLLSYTNLSQKDALWMGVALIALFFIGVFSFPGRLDKTAVAMMLMVLFSRAGMLLYERANVDLLIFFLCAMALAFSERTLTAAVIMGAASILKLFPFFGFSMFAFEGKGIFLRLLIGSTIVFAVYLALISHHVQTAWRRTERGGEFSYGASVVVTNFKYFRPQLRPVLDQWGVGPKVIPVLTISVSTLAALVVVLLSCVAGIRTRASLATRSQRNLNAFWMGASLYVGTFLLGNNWDYRLIFLVFVVPQLSEWIKQSVGRRRAGMLGVFGLVLVSCWYFFYYLFLIGIARDTLFLIDEFVNWSLLAGLAYLLAASAPEWIRGMVRIQPGSFQWRPA